jgi:uncharacterized protein YndB with AHSA1/START domain
MTDSKEVTLTRIIDAPADLVFDAWTKGEHLQRWYAPDGFTVPSATADARDGGAFELVMRNPDGMDFPLWGTFRELDRPRRLVIDATAAAGPDRQPALRSVTTVTLLDQGGKTEITVHEQAEPLIPEAVMMLAGMELGLTQSLRHLDDLLTGAFDRQISITRMIEAPREVVFAAWMSDEHLSQWWGPNGFTLTTDEIDVRPGGRWLFTMHGPDGVDYPNEIVYEEVVRPEIITFEHGAPGRDDPSFRGVITFDDFMGNTVLTMRSVFQTKEHMDDVVERVGAIEGGNQTLDRLVGYVTERLQPTIKARHDT